ncbi:hypothetical protein pEaSNUABM27_00008 [Erwinia phage pEa_SNUABM_27]|nr:hypothetical protein pEaSNUABM27_00008 [Erwinia phage pEa_SNUABM_27]
MAILRRNKLGQMTKARVRVGDIATISKSSTVLGLTANKGYKVYATSLSSEDKRSYIGAHYQWACVTENHFVVINDRGEKTFCSLTPKHPNYDVAMSKANFGEWTV